MGGGSFDHALNIATARPDRISGGPVISHSSYRLAMTCRRATYRARPFLGHVIEEPESRAGDCSAKSIREGASRMTS